MNHKKINLASELVAWEHERFSLSKVQGLTLSHFASHKDSDIQTMTDTRDSLNDTILIRNIKVIAESLGQFIYNISDDVEIFSNDMVRLVFFHYLSKKSILILFIGSFIKFY